MYTLNIRNVICRLCLNLNLPRVTQQGEGTVRSRARTWAQVVCWESLWWLHLRLLEHSIAFETFLRDAILVHSLERWIGISQVGVVGGRRWEYARVFWILEAAWTKDMGVWTVLVGMEVLRRVWWESQVPTFPLGSPGRRPTYCRITCTHTDPCLEPAGKAGWLVNGSRPNHARKQLLVVFWVSLKKSVLFHRPSPISPKPLYVDLSKFFLYIIMLLAPSLRIRSCLTPPLQSCTFYLPWICNPSGLALSVLHF